MVALIGEAGLGKSRLIEETRAYWSARRPGVPLGDADIRRIWEVWQCVSYDTTRPYAQYRRMLSGIAGIAGVAWKDGKLKGATGRPVPLLTTWLLAQETSA